MLTVQVQVQWYRGIRTLYRYTIKLNCKHIGKVATGTGTQYSYIVQVQRYRYTIQLNYKGTGKMATGTGTQYRYWYTAHLKIHC